MQDGGEGVGGDDGAVVHLRGTAEIAPRLSRDCAEVKPRSRRGLAETSPRGSGSSSSVERREAAAVSVRGCSEVLRGRRYLSLLLKAARGVHVCCAGLCNDELIINYDSLAGKGSPMR